MSVVYCLPPAGVDAQCFDALASLALRASNTLSVDDTVDVRVLDLPVTQYPTRRRALRTLESVVDHLAEQVLSTLRTDRYVVLGESMGGLLAYELYHHMAARRAPLPSALVVSSVSAPHLPARSRVALDDAGLVRFAQALGSLPAWVLAGPGWVQPYIGVLRDDVAMCQSYHHRPRTPIPVPLHVFVGHDDWFVPLAAAHAWRELGDDVRVSVLPGGHFLAADLKSGLARAVLDLTIALPDSPPITLRRTS